MPYPFFRFGRFCQEAAPSAQAAILLHSEDIQENLHMESRHLQAPKRNANNNDNSQAGPLGWRQHNPQVQGVNYNPNGYYDRQTGPPGWRQYNPQVPGGNYDPKGYYFGRDHNPQVQGGNKVDVDGKITLGPEIGNINLSGGKAGGDQTGGGNYNANSNYNARGKKKDKDDATGGDN